MKYMLGDQEIKSVISIGTKHLKLAYESIIQVIVRIFCGSCPKAYISRLDLFLYERTMGGMPFLEANIGVKSICICEM